MNAQNLLKGWTSAKLSSLIETFERGISYTSEDIQDMHGLPLVNLACIDKSGFYRDGELKSFSGSYTKSDLIYPLDMLIACTDLTRNADIIGTPILVPTDYEEYVYTMDLAKLKPKPCIDNRFLYYALKTSTYRNYIKPWASGTNVLHLNLQGVYDYVLQFPIDIKEQRRIANLLSSLDNKIALNRAINQNLEALAKQLYDYWFVQFDFPNEEGKPYKSSGGKMVWNEKLKREIPKGWEVTNIGGILDKVISTPRLSTDEYLSNGTYPVIDQTTDVYYAGFTNNKDAVVNQFPAVVFGDHSCAVKFVNFPFVRGADGTQVMLSKYANISVEYLYFVVKGIKIGKGYARHYSFLKEQPIIVPPQKEAKKFEGMAHILFEQITRNRKEILSLTKQRDELLPLLMNGQVSLLNCD